MKYLSPSQELLSVCGGDLCSALPWLALLSANFSYNALTALDSSLVSALEWERTRMSLGRRASWLTGVPV
jgi:hypothetical protein